MSTCCSRPSTLLRAVAKRPQSHQLRQMVVTRASSSAWRENIIEKTEDIHKIALEAKRIAVLGIKTEEKVWQSSAQLVERFN